MSEARRAAEAMREAAARAAIGEDKYPQSDSWRSAAITIAARIRALPVPDASHEHAPGALMLATESLSAVLSDDCAEPETLAKARAALLAISKLHSWWGAQQIALDALGGYERNGR